MPCLSEPGMASAREERLRRRKARRSARAQLRRGLRRNFALSVCAKGPCEFRLSGLRFGGWREVRPQPGFSSQDQARNLTANTASGLPWVKLWSSGERSLRPAPCPREQTGRGGSRGRMRGVPVSARCVRRRFLSCVPAPPSSGRRSGASPPAIMERGDDRSARTGRKPGNRRMVSGVRGAPFQEEGPITRLRYVASGAASVGSVRVHVARAFAVLPGSSAGGSREWLPCGRVISRPARGEAS